MRPDILYKYVAPDRIDILVNKKIRFTQPCLWNDPFEFIPATPDPGPDRLGPVEKRAAKKRDSRAHEQARLYGVLSLTEKKDSILMWAHYAAAHTGFVIGFNTGRGLLAEAERKLQKVLYHPERPSSTRGLPGQPWRGPDTIHVIKNSDWQHEREWRWIETCSPYDYAEVVAAPNGELLFLRRIPSDSIREVVLGCRSGSSLEESLRTLKSGDPDYRDLDLFKAARSSHGYGLVIKPL